MEEGDGAESRCDLRVVGGGRYRWLAARRDSGERRDVSRTIMSSSGGLHRSARRSNASPKPLVELVPIAASTSPSRLKSNVASDAAVRLPEGAR